MKDALKLFVPLLFLFVVALFNLIWKLGSTRLEEWDESRRGVSAFEMLTSSDASRYIAPTYRGQLDYWASKPPLGLWAISGSFALFGAHRFALRIPFAIAGLLTILFVCILGKQRASWKVGILAALILSTCYPFLFDHSVRNGEYDGILILFVTLTALICELNFSSILIKGVLLGVILGATFLLKSFAIIFPITIIGTWYALNRYAVNKWCFFLCIICMLGLTTLPWIVLRYNVDGWKFFQAMIANDLAARTFSSIEGHGKYRFWYFVRFFKETWPWNGVALIVFLVSLWGGRLNTIYREYFLLLTWFAAPLIIGTMMATKISWYILPLYPAFALLLALAINHYMHKKWMMMLFVIAFLVAEGRVVQRVRSLTRPRPEEVQLAAFSPGTEVRTESWSQVATFFGLVERGLKPID